jgi:hypothetical protein
MTPERSRDLLISISQTLLGQLNLVDFHRKTIFSVGCSQKSKIMTPIQKVFLLCPMDPRTLPASLKKIALRGRGYGLPAQHAPPKKNFGPPAGKIFLGGP